MKSYKVTRRVGMQNEYDTVYSADGTSCDVVVGQRYELDTSIVVAMDLQDIANQFGGLHNIVKIEEAEPHFYG